MALLMTGCSSLGSNFVPANMVPHLAKVYVYRPAQDYDASNYEDSYVYIGDKQMGRLAVGSYAQFDLTPGYHLLEIKDGVLFSFPGITHSSLGLTLEADTVYYVRLEKHTTQLTKVESTQLNSSQTSVTMVPEAQALSELQHTKAWH